MASIEQSDGTGARHVKRSAELLWGTPERPARGPKPGLTLDRIVDAAIAVADADGVEALSMRRVARELGVGTMSLYRHVPGKPVLLDLMLDKVSDPSDLYRQATEQDWRGALEAAARGTYHLYLAHPWLLQVNWTRPVFGPNTLSEVELIVGGLSGLGLTDQERVTVMLVLDGFVTGLARTRILYAAATEETGLSDDEFWAEQDPTLEQAMATGNYPAIAALAEDAFALDWEQSFEFGLRRLLDGIEVLVNSRATAGPPH